MAAEKAGGNLEIPLSLTACPWTAGGCQGFRTHNLGGVKHQWYSLNLPASHSELVNTLFNLFNAILFNTPAVVFICNLHNLCSCLMIFQFFRFFQKSLAASAEGALYKIFTIIRLA